MVPRLGTLEQCWLYRNFEIPCNPDHVISGSRSAPRGLQSSHLAPSRCSPTEPFCCENEANRKPPLSNRSLRHHRNGLDVFLGRASSRRSVTATFSGVSRLQSSHLAPSRCSPTEPFCCENEADRKPPLSKRSLRHHRSSGPLFLGRASSRRSVTATFLSLRQSSHLAPSRCQPDRTVGVARQLAERGQS